jgi:hypothetical protein
MIEGFQPNTYVLVRCHVITYLGFSVGAPAPVIYRRHGSLALR